MTAAVRDQSATLQTSKVTGDICVPMHAHNGPKWRGPPTCTCVGASGCGPRHAPGWSQGRINHLVGPTHSTTPGPHGNSTPKRDRGVGSGVPSSTN